MTDKITVDRENLRQVLELMHKALDTDNVFGMLHNDAMDCIGGLRAALDAAPVQEPVARFNWSQGGFEWLTKYDFEKHNMQPLYLAQRTEAVRIYNDTEPT